MTPDTRWRELPSPLGRLLLAAGDDGLRGVWLPEERRRPLPGAAGENDHLDAAVAQLDQYFAGERTSFELDLSAPGTPWQQRVWCELTQIPFGSTITYRELAQRAGRPAAIRAAGTANGANPLSIVVPCHRVIGSDGELHGYAGGLPAKRWLLAHERAGSASGSRSGS